MSGRFRVEVDDEYGTVALVIDPPELDRRQQKTLSRVMATVVGHAYAVLGVSEEHARHILLCELTRRYADELAAGRVAARPSAESMTPLF